MSGGLSGSVGVSYEPVPSLVVAEALLPDQPNGPSVVTHELGHSYGINVGDELEDYELPGDNNPGCDRIGIPVEPGLWVEKRIPMVVAPDREIYAFMGCYRPSEEFWVKAADYTRLFTDHADATSFSSRPLLILTR